MFTLILLIVFSIGNQVECRKRKVHEANINTKIIGGDIAKYGEFPFMLSMNYTEYGHFCGASAISDYWALTAAHCVLGGSTNFLLRAGSLNSDENGTVHYVAEVIAHNLFSSVNLDHDIAVIKVIEPFSINPYVTTYVTLPYQGEDVELGSEATVIGWGRTISGYFSDTSPILKKAVVDILKNDECSESRTSMGRHIVTKDELCAQKRGHLAFKGDSGGPLFVTHNNIFKQIGIVSWGDPVGLQAIPGVFAKVSSFILWIHLKTGL